MKHEYKDNLNGETRDLPQTPDEIRETVLKMAANARAKAEEKATGEVFAPQGGATNDNSNDKSPAPAQASDFETDGNRKISADETNSEHTVDRNAAEHSKNRETAEKAFESTDAAAKSDAANGEATNKNTDEKAARESEASGLFIDEQKILELLPESVPQKADKKSRRRPDKRSGKAGAFKPTENPKTDNDDAQKPERQTKADESGTLKAEETLENEEKPTKKKPLIKRILCYLFPVKGDPFKEILRKVIFLLALVTFLGAAGYLIHYYNQGYVNENMVSKARGIYNAGSTDKNKDGMMIRFEELYRENPDIKGWIRIDGTKIDYPVYQADNNDYYIDHDMSRNQSRYGAVFADADARIEKDGVSQNTVLYGHNMIDGSMFTGLLKYKELKFYRENPVINFDTLYSTGQYKVFAVIITNVNAEDDNGFVFNYRLPSFSSDTSFENWITNVKTRSILDTGIDVKTGDEILTLSTCSYEFDDARTVVFARKVRDDESRYIDTTKAKINKNVLYPQAYYDRNGGKKPDITDAVVSARAATSSGSAIKGYTENGESYTTDNIDKSLINRNVTVSSYVGMSLSAAISSINDSGLYIQSIEYDGEDIPKNEVLKQSLKAGTKVKYGTGIVLKVSGTPANITVPKLVGLTLKKAEKAATKAGMTLSIVRMASAKKNDIVLMQSEKPKTVTEDRSLVIYVSNGRNRVPSVKNMKTADAVKKLHDAGFKSKVVYIETSLKKQVGIVGGQSLEADSFQNVGKTVKIYVGKKATKNASQKSTSSKKATSSKAASNTSKSGSKTTSTVSSKPTPSKTGSTASAKPASSGTPTTSSGKTESGGSSSAAASSTQTESGGTSAE